MALARLYLLHKIKILEVRERDRCAEISVLRDESPDEEGSCSINVLASKPEVTHTSEDDELSILMDARMIKDIDQSCSALQCMRQLLSEKNQELQEIEKSMDGISTTHLAHEASMSNFEPLNISGSSGVKCTCLYRASSHPRDGGTRMLPPKINNMAMSQEKDNCLLPQGEFGAPRGRHGSAPDAAGSTAIEWESGEGTVGLD